MPDRSAETLLPIIQEHILPWTEIHSEMWRAYCQISRLPAAPRYRHLTVNHSRNCVDPVTHACTIGIENMWMREKNKIHAVNDSRAEPIWKNFHCGRSTGETAKRLSSQFFEI